ncbi:hypothetical protein N7462_004257 [Penicillium macrosclerotiorum]|uniref:uncharacterized protein n=1 Tax=Penicillium macrosclerotiorum TaxID=303699 RepID=UPI002549BB68|nr:uncharacterized protein N7462_004257 [Penicillium macrosclerotiorum]KAJ5689865.1 hypothetical protein N7462_004257 [Penicillium macrosclerotiorum]
MNSKVILLGTSHPHIFHRIKYLQDRHMTILGYFDSDENVSREMQKHVNCTRFTDPVELLSLDFDAVFIHGEDVQNPSYIQSAIASGAKGIFVEKPGAAHPEQFNKLIPQIEAHGVIFEVGWELHYLEIVEFARNVLRTSLLGHITEARFHGGCPGGAGAEAWQSNIHNIGGFFYSLGGHVVETATDLFGLPTQVVASIRKLPKEKPHSGYSWVPGLFEQKELNPMKAIGTLEYEDIASAILEYKTKNVHLDFTAWEPSGYLDDWTMDIYGVQGALHLNFDTPGGYLLLKDAKGEWKKGRNDLFPETIHKKGEMLQAAFIKQMDSFFRRIQSRDEGLTNCNEKAAFNVLHLFQKLYESAEKRSWITIEE